MTVPAAARQATYALAAGVTGYAANFPIIGASDLLVYTHATPAFDPDAPGALLTLGVHYTIAPAAIGATVVPTAAMPTAGFLTLYRVTSLAQTAAYTPNDGFPAASHEAQLDRLSLVDQEQQAVTEEIRSRALLLPAGEAATPIPPVAARIGGQKKIFAVDQDTGAIGIEPIGDVYVGPSGPANSTFKTLAELKAAPAGNRSYTLATATGRADYSLVAGDFTGRTDDRTVVALDAVPVGIGALVLASGTASPVAATFATALLAARETPQNGKATDRAVAQTPVFIPPGVYEAGDIALNVYTAANPSGTSRLLLRAEPGTVTIRVPDGKYFATIDGRFEAVFVEGIRFVGGKGALRFANTANNVNRLVVIQHNEFLDYTECALGNMADDSPYWRVRDNVFEGTAKSIGVALGGYLDASEIVGNVFLRNRYHVKVGDRLSGSILISDNDFIKNGEDFARVADIWVVPNAESVYGEASGWQTLITGNKFGPENLGLLETRVLVAGEDATSGVDRLTRRHSTESAPGFVSGLNFTANRIGCKYLAGGMLPDGNDAPFLTSYAPKLQALTWRDNKLEGGRYQWLAFLYYPAPNDDTAFAYQNWNIQIDPSEAYQYGVVGTASGNAMPGSIADPAGVMLADRNSRPLFDAPSDTSITLLDNLTFPQLAVAGGATLAPVADDYGGNALALLTLPSANAFAGGGFTDINLPGAPVWIEAEFAPAGANLINEVIFEVVNGATGQCAFRRYLRIVDRRVLQWKFRLPNKAAGIWEYRLRASDRGAGYGNVVFGRVYATAGDAPVNTRHLRVAGGGATQGHVVIGAAHLWRGADARLRIKPDGAPANDAAGSVIPVAAAAQADSTATTVAGVVADLNALLAKLRVSGSIGA